MYDPAITTSTCVTLWRENVKVHLCIKSMMLMKTPCEELRRQLVDNSQAEWKEIPTSYYAIDLALQMLVEKLKRRVMTIAECKQEAEMLHMDEKATMAALRYLHGSTSSSTTMTRMLCQEWCLSMGRCSWTRSLSWWRKATS